MTDTYRTNDTGFLTRESSTIAGATVESTWLGISTCTTKISRAWTVGNSCSTSSSCSEEQEVEYNNLETRSKSNSHSFFFFFLFFFF